MKPAIRLADKRTGEELSFYATFKPDAPCPVCGKPTGRRSGSYCLQTQDGQMVICGHAIAGGRQIGEAGRLFDYTTGHGVEPATTFRIRKPDDRPAADFAPIVRKAIAQGRSRLPILADQIGVSIDALVQLGTGWLSPSDLAEHNTRHRGDDAWTFPMVDHRRRLIGVRVRGGGEKFSLYGSRNGLFWPKGLSGEGPLLMAEGPTDTAALLDIGFDAIGRPAARAAREMAVSASNGRTLVVVADRGDTDGREGAKLLAEAAAASDKSRSVRWIYPPNGKDARECTANYDAWCNAIACARLVS